MNDISRKHIPGCGFADVRDCICWCHKKAEPPLVDRLEIILRKKYGPSYEGSEHQLLIKILKELAKL